MTLNDKPEILHNTIAIYVHKLIADRVIAHLLQEELEWKTTKTPVAPLDDQTVSRKRSLSITSSSTSSSYRILSSEQITGVSKLRRGYHLVLLSSVNSSLVSTISPMARKNISWASQVQFQITYHPTTIGKNLLQSMTNFDYLTNQNHTLRVDVHPRHDTERICLALQQAAAGSIVNTDPFEGPISMTKSATHCTHRMVVIIEQDIVYWGTMDRSIPTHEQLMTTKFNHQATEQIRFQPSNDQSGSDMGPTITDVTIPLSRAYYKLEQVWQDVLCHIPQIPLQSGLDLGACPGGWTQVLVHRAHLPKVVAVDPAQLANRVLHLPQVQFVQHALESLEAATEISRHGKERPYSHIVCDASLILHNVFDKVVGTMLQALPDKTIFTLPSCWVITIKLPFKTLPSLQRHMVRAREWAPLRLEEIKNLIYPLHQVKVLYTFAHLMANSDSERTLIAIMEEELSVGDMTL